MIVWNADSLQAIKGKSDKTNMKHLTKSEEGIVKLLIEAAWILGTAAVIIFLTGFALGKGQLRLLAWLLAIAVILVALKLLRRGR